MQNAHLRLGRLQYTRNTEKTNTQISVHVDHYIGNGEQAHLLSFFGGDAEVGGIRAPIYEKHTFTLTFPNGATKYIGFGPDAACYNGSLSLQGTNRDVAAPGRRVCLARGERNRGPDLHHESGAGDEGTHLGHFGQSARPASGPALGQCRTERDAEGKADTTVGWDRMQSGGRHRNPRGFDEEDRTSSRTRFAALSGEEWPSRLATVLHP
jgi:hypothetical protein